MCVFTMLSHNSKWSHKVYTNSLLNGKTEEQKWECKSVENLPTLTDQPLICSLIKPFTFYSCCMKQAHQLFDMRSNYFAQQKPEHFSSFLQA